MFQELVDRRLKLIADMRGMLEKADKESGGVLSSEAEASYNEMDKEQDKLSKQIERRARQQEIESGLEKPVNKVVFTGSSAPASNTEERARLLQSKCFRSYLQHGPMAIHSPDFVELRSLNAGLVTEGGAFVPPQQWVNELIKALDDAVFIRGLSRTFSLTSAASLGCPVLDADFADHEWTTELSTGSLDESMRTGLRELKPLPLAKRVKVSRKLLSSSIQPVETIVRDRMAYKLGITQEKAFLTGNGATAPLGVFTASDSGIPTSRDVSTDNTATAFTADGLIECMFSLKGAYQANATWIMHRSAVKMARKLKDGNGQYIWQPGLTAVAGDTLLGRPLKMSEFAPSTFTSGLYVGVLGDFNYYWIADAIGTMQVQKLVELYAETNQDGFISRLESDGMPVLGEAFARVKLG